MSVVSGFSYYREITADSAKVDAALPNYPGRVVLTSSNFDFSAVLSNGYDIVFSDESDNLLDFERTYFDAAGEKAVFDVRIPSVSASVDTKIKIHYGKAGTVDLSNKTGVWDPNFIGVWHLGEDVKDSTINARHGTNQGTTEVAGLNGRARNFGGSPQHIDLDDMNTWSNKPTTGATVSLLSYRNANQSAAPAFLGGTGTFFLLNYDAPPTAKCYLRGNDAWITAEYALTQTPVANTYLHTMTYDKVTLKAIVDNVVEGSTATTADITYKTSDLARLGRYNDGYFEGKMEELRISNIVRSAAWQKADYYGLRLNTLLTVGAEQGGSTPTATGRRFVQLI